MKICASNVFCLHHVVTHYLLISHPGLKSCSQAQCRDSKPCATRDYAHELCIQTCRTVLTSMKSHSFIVASAAPWYNLNLWLSHLSGDDRSRIMRVCEGACAHMPLATWYQWAGSGVGVKGDQCYSEKKFLVIAGDWLAAHYLLGRGRDSTSSGYQNIQRSTPAGHRRILSHRESLHPIPIRLIFRVKLALCTLSKREERESVHTVAYGDMLAFCLFIPV